MAEDTDHLAKRLTEHGYAALLGEHPDQFLVESIKSEPDIAPKLQGIINNRNTSWQARFIASEFLFRHVDMRLHHQCDRAKIEDSYFQAMHHNYTGNGVDWGFGKDPNDLGILGHAVLSWSGSLKPFRLSLDDDQPVTMNFSWRIPLHFHPPYRVKDFAALIITKADGLAVDLAGSPTDRDKAITKLKQMLAL